MLFSCVHTEKMSVDYQKGCGSGPFLMTILITMQHTCLVAEHMIMENLANPINTGILMDANICASTNHIV